MTTATDAVRARLKEIRERAEGARVSGLGADHERWHVCKHDIPALLDLVEALLAEREASEADDYFSTCRCEGCIAISESVTAALSRFTGEEK